ncbi:MAG: ATP-dependent helicase [Proteobacteria bacterium]|nr:ATP-dependent helicase [Pseudomonadota bacterium]MBU4297507.1 ATP-dependent helicase [Pseudomonadota bacterium]MCG2749725.1 ATP-dependent helicase [Desulfobulbaceae bacterium]
MEQTSLFPLNSSSANPLPSRIGPDDLNPPQFEAVRTINGPVLVIAGAGSGKTRTLVYRLVHMVEQGIAPDNILLLTFTRKAAQQMVSRAATLLDDTCQRVMGGTFHAVANLLLRRYGHHVGYAPNFTILDRADAEGIINLIKSSLDLSGAGKRFPSKRVILNIISGSVNKSHSLEELVSSQYFHLAEFMDDLHRIRNHYQQFKRDHGLMDYDDLLVNFRDVLAENENVRREVSARFQYLMVDEYQDTNKIQAQIVRLIASSHDNVMVVGDDSQSIYSFRGADFRNIMDFPKIYSGTKIIRLEENYRSSQKILEMTNAIIEQAQERYPKKLFSNIAAGEKPALFAARDEKEQARYVAQKIDELHRQGTPYHEMAVLFRAGFHSFKLELELAGSQIAFEKWGGLKLTETAHVKDVISYLRLIANMRDSLSWHRILLHLPKVGPKTAQKIVATVAAAEDPLAALSQYPPAPAWKNEFNELVRMLYDLGNSRTPLAQFERIMEYYQPVFERLYHDDYPSRARDLEQFKNIIGEYQTLQDFLDDASLDPPNLTADPLAASDNKTLILSTIHSAKGLEWDTVFIIDLADGKFPSAHSIPFPDQFEEERRLLYVAATRAKTRLFLTYPRETIAPDRSRHFCTISPFLAQLSAGLINNVSPGSSFYSGYSALVGRFSHQEKPDSIFSCEKKDKFSQTNAASDTGKITSTSLLSEGVAVKHPFFGHGQIKKISGEKTVDVFFPRHGMKTLRLDYAQLEFA